MDNHIAMLAHDGRGSLCLVPRVLGTHKHTQVECAVGMLRNGIHIPCPSRGVLLVFVCVCVCVFVCVYVCFLVIVEMEGAWSGLFGGLELIR